ncbi:PAS domain-containing protein [Streptomyces cucumeris]|uniref:PAS domain-containing protein n=1 Tax=Streptomyces cucumeris TaxID=2962890 RepID=UPI0020C92FB5|nr:PAS domain-containing protein [Streptomyces sp. NEAU-Y11]MCP9213444.1 PAS domain-containing protein [Streptomyces sp. NEAU-Y11]
MDLADTPWWSRSHAAVERFLKDAPFGIGVLDTDLKFVWTNGAMDRMSGVPLADRIGRSVEDVLPRLAPGLLADELRRVLSTGEARGLFEYRGYVPADPDRMHAFSATALRLEDSDGRVLGVCYTGVDITERRRTKERMDLLTDSGKLIGTTLDLRHTGRRPPDDGPGGGRSPRGCAAQ